MLGIQKNITFSAFGLNISSDFPFLELPIVDLPGSNVDVVIEKRDLTEQRYKYTNPNSLSFVDENQVLFEIPHVAIFLIENGNKISVSPMEGSKEDQLRLYILGTCMGALLMQRRILPLHGSALAIGGEAYAIIGDSGAGKSTLARSFLKRGFNLLSDDVIPITFDKNNIPIVTPSYPQQKLWLESLDHFGLESDNYCPIIDRETKYTIPITDSFETNSMPLAGVIELTKSELNQTIQFQPIQELERLYTLFAHTYRNFIIKRAGLMEWHFQASAKIASKSNLYKMERPISRFTADELVELILTNVVRKEEFIHE
ncbi:HPr kinase/phosphorylase [Aquibacillus albus]|uniref:Aldolase n=1 Tax=Aquibacillus albus TaxID=1168171 RepID=A0ABS2N5U5_9BACI|nr:aldolase [Aquibacillus albus]MBM7573494.1 hypothetical protein [Aquibacillus albus]